MKENVFDADLVAYMALSECAKSESNKSVCEDILSKMNVHAKKIKSNNSGVVIRV